MGKIPPSTSRRVQCQPPQAALRPCVASCPSRPSLLCPWLTRSHSHHPSMPTKPSHRRPCPLAFWYHRPPRASLPLAPRTAHAPLRRIGVFHFLDRVVHASLEDRRAEFQ